MSDELTRIKARARELARSGRFIGWRPVAFELQFEPASRTCLTGSIAPRPKKSWIASAARRGSADAILRLPKGSA